MSAELGDERSYSVESPKGPFRVHQSIVTLSSPIADDGGLCPTGVDSVSGCPSGP
jgi:hypothetical protein